MYGPNVGQWEEKDVSQWEEEDVGKWEEEEEMVDIKIEEDDVHLDDEKWTKNICEPAEESGAGEL
jgi:hypothetical protein